MIRELEYLAIKPYEELYYQESIEENLHILILQEIERLPDYLKQIFILAYIEGLSNAEITANFFCLIVYLRSRQF